MKDGAIINKRRNRVSSLNLSIVLGWSTIICSFLWAGIVQAQSATQATSTQGLAESDKALDPTIAKQLSLMDHTAIFPSSVAIAPDGEQIAWSVPPSGTAWSTSSAGGTVLFVGSVSTPGRELPVAPPISADQSCSSNTPVWSPDSEMLAFTASCTTATKSGSRPRQEVFVWSRSTHEVRQITHLNGGISNLIWSSDGRHLLMLYIDHATRNPGYFDAAAPNVGVIGKNFDVSRLYQVEVSSGEGTYLTPPDLHVFEFGVAKNSSVIAFLATNPPGDATWSLAKLYILDNSNSGSGANVRLLFDAQTAPGLLHGAQMAIPRLSPDGNRVAFLCGLMTDPTIYGGDVCVADTSAGQSSPIDVTPGITGSAQYGEWLTNDIFNFVETRDGHTLLVDWNVKTQQPIKGSTHDLGEVTVYGGGPEGPAAPAVADISYAPARHAMAFAVQGHSVAPEVYIERGGTLKQFTHLNSNTTAPTHTISLDWKSEGYNVQGWLTFPANYDPHKHYPLLVEVHGGPEWSIGSRWDGNPWSGINSFWAGLGYFVLHPNPRGSYGQGEAFTRANRRDIGYGDLRDILKGVDTAEAQYPIDSHREGMLGWSYGACMAMFATTQNHRFRASVGGAGIYDWISFYGETSYTSFTLPLLGSTPYDDPAIYARSSALTYVKQSSTPSLLLAGERDGGATPDQSMEFWRGLLTQNVPTQLVIYAGEGHHFNKTDENDTLARTAMWFEQYMGEQTAAKK